MRPRHIGIQSKDNRPTGITSTSHNRDRRSCHNMNATLQIRHSVNEMTFPYTHPFLLSPRGDCVRWSNTGNWYELTGNDVISLLKSTALASTITITDMTGIARTIVADTYAPYEIFISLAIVYMIFTLGLQKLFHLFEKYLSRYTKREA